MKLEKLESVGMHYLSVDTEIVKSFAKKGHKRAIAVFESGIEWHCAFLRMKTGEYYIVMGADICRKLRIKLGDEVNVTFKEDTTEYQFEMPKVFAEVLLQEPEAAAVFEALTDGNKRGLMYLISSMKSTEKRIERALLIAEKMKIGVTSPKLVLKKNLHENR